MKKQPTLSVYEPPLPPVINPAEVFRYLGYGTNQPDQASYTLFKRCVEELSACVRPKCVYTVIPITVMDDYVKLQGCDLVFQGHDIAAHLKYSSHVVMLAATLSGHADRLIRQAQASDLSFGLVMDSCATAAVEQLCDDAVTTIKRQLSDCYFTTRYSPGYGDFPIEIQRDFLKTLDAPRKIGLCANDSSILTPRKSVTAVIGVGNKPTQSVSEGCAECLLRNSCSFRKRGDTCEFSRIAE